MKLFSFLLLLAFAPAASAQWRKQSAATDADFRGVCAISDKVAWVGGTKGTVGRTTDGGTTWTFVATPGAEKLDVRDVEAFNDSTAYALTIGPGEDSRVYKTRDGGKSWTLQFQNPDREAFYDALAFWDETHGLALSDPVNGKYRLIATDDGTTWKPLAADGLTAQPGEGAFAASGTCLVTRGDRDAWFVTGGAKAARVFRSADRGKTWAAADLPIPAGVASAGAFSIAWRDAENGVVVGGDYKQPKAVGRTAAVTRDGGKTWTPVEMPFRSGVAWAKGRWVAVGAAGTHTSADGVTWAEQDGENHNAVSFTQDGHGWAVGPKGRIAAWAWPK